MSDTRQAAGLQLLNTVVRTIGDTEGFSITSLPYSHGPEWVAVNVNVHGTPLAVLRYRDGTIQVEDLDSGRRKLHSQPRDSIRHRLQAAA